MSGLLEKAQQRYSTGVFVHTPVPDFDPKETLSLLHETYFGRGDKETPVFSIVMPIHNQEAIIRRNLDAVLRHTTEKPYEIILIVDCCSDDTEAALNAWVEESTFPELCVGLIVFKSTLPLFECSADNLGFLCARGEYVLEIQADIHLLKDGYNMHLMRPFDYFENLLGVSGRCGHTLTKPESVGRGSQHVEYPLPPEFPRDVFYVTETCIRGPLLIHRPKLEELGYMDEANFYLDKSDHDLFSRAFVEKGWWCGYTPVEYESPLEHGSMRKPRDAVNTEYLEKRKARETRGKLEEYFQAEKLPYRPIQRFQLDF